MLGEVIANGGVNRSAKPKQIDFNVDGINIDEIEVSDSPVTISVIAQRINNAKPENMKKLKTVAISNWLVSINMLEVVTINNKNRKRVTGAGVDIGLTEEERLGQFGRYFAVMYNKSAQQFIIDNLNAIIDGGFN